MYGLFFSVLTFVVVDRLGVGRWDGFVGAAGPTARSTAGWISSESSDAAFCLKTRTVR